MSENLNKSLHYVADSIESGYSALFTYGTKEILCTKERRELTQLLRELADGRTVQIPASSLPTISIEMDQEGKCYEPQPH